MMEYEDDEYDQYQQYEDELYKDASEESESDGEVDSDLEDNMLAHIHYSTNVYKNVGPGTSKSSEDQTGNKSISNNGATDSHLAASPTAAEDYFKSVNQGNELDSETEEGIIKSSSRANKTAAATINVGKKSNDKDVDLDKEIEESRYSAEKKDTRKNKWSQQAIVEGIHSSNEDSGEEESEESDGDEQSTSGDDPKIQEYESQLDQHVIDLGASRNDTQDNTNDYDLDVELGHLEDEDFKGRSRYYLESKERAFLCYRCKQSGHQQRDCTALLCNTCGAIDDHSFFNCPISVCYNCKEKGHISENCPRPRGYGSYQYCERCQSKAHVTNDCPTVWREYVTTSKEPLQDAVKYCYNCAALGHFGDDCSEPRPSYAKHAESAFKSLSRVRIGGSSSKADHSQSTSKFSSGSTARHNSSASRYNSQSDRHDNDSRSSSSRHDRGHHDDYRSSRGESRSQSYSKDDYRRGDHRDSRSESYDSHPDPILYLKIPTTEIRVGYKVAQVGHHLRIKMHIREVAGIKEMVQQEAEEMCRDPMD
ncbi:hypothetical protein BGZ46_007892 [Entomortierella lignicola]|nr:hypothetical protein BGZ46_007892 [Entomortierella lignicola]